MANDTLKMKTNGHRDLQSIDAMGNEITHSQDIASNGDYLGRQPSDMSGRNHFDEEYLIDKSEPASENAPNHATSE
jgi:hypothetical protein